jgi:tRNA A58 N-methylase Trm61
VPFRDVDPWRGSACRTGTARLVDIRYLGMARTLLAEIHLRPGESIVEVGYGSSVVTRGLAHSTGGTNRIIGVHINRYLLGVE